MLLTVDRGNIRRSPQTSDIGPVIGAFFRTLQHAQRQSLLPGCVCVCVRAHWGFASRKRSGPWCVRLHSSLRPVLHGCMLSRAPLVLPSGKCDRVGEALQPGPRRAKGVCGRRGGLAYVRVVET